MSILLLTKNGGFDVSLCCLFQFLFSSFERAAHSVYRMFSLYYVNLLFWLFFNFGYDDRTVILIYNQFLVVIGYILLSKSGYLV